MMTYNGHTQSLTNCKIFCVRLTGNLFMNEKNALNINCYSDCKCSTTVLVIMI